MIKLSATVRALLAAAVAGATAALTLTSDGVSVQDCIIIFLAAAGTFGVVPPQVGGTQEGVVNPAVKDMPPSDNIK